MFKAVVAKANSDCSRYVAGEIHVSLVSYILDLNKFLLTYCGDLTAHSSSDYTAYISPKSFQNTW